MPFLFRIAGLLVILVNGALGMAGLFTGGPAELMHLVPNLVADKAGLAYYVLLGFLCLILAAFGALFWLSTSQSVAWRLPWWLPFALGAQLVLGVFFPDLMMLVACEGGFLFGRKSSYWMWGQTLFFVVFLWMVQASGWLEILQLATWQLFAFAAGFVGGRELDSRRSLAHANAQLQATQQVLEDSTRISERVNIARELHDTLGHHLTALSLKLQYAGRIVEGAAAKPVEEAHMLAKLLLSDVRAAVSSMRDEGAVDLSRAIGTISAAIEQPRIDVQITGTVHDSSRAQVLLRCVQEAVTNAVRHSQASSMSIRLCASEGKIELEMKDNGRGEASLRPGNGLRGMRERVEELGGKLELETAPGQGFRLLAQL